MCKYDWTFGFQVSIDFIYWEPLWFRTTEEYGHGLQGYIWRYVPYHKSVTCEKNFLRIFHIFSALWFNTWYSSKYDAKMIQSIGVITYIDSCNLWLLFSVITFESILIRNKKIKLCSSLTVECSCMFLLIPADLLTESVDGDLPQLPSPDKLRRKVIIKVCINRTGAMNLWIHHFYFVYQTLPKSSSHYSFYNDKSIILLYVTSKHSHRMKNSNLILTS